MSALLTLLVAIPLAVAALIFVLRPPVAVQAVAYAGAALAQAALSLTVCATVRDGRVLRQAIGGWAEGAAIVFHADALTGLMLAVTSLVALIVVPFAIRSGRAAQPAYVPMALIVVAGVAWALLTADLFNLYVGIEVMLLPSYAVMVSARRGTGRLMQVTATRIYLTLNLLTSATLLLGIGTVYAGSGQLGYAALLGAAHHSPITRVGVALILVALCAKAAVVPMFGWLGRAYPHMPATVTALFSGLHTKVALYAIYRLHSVFFAGQPAWQRLGLVVVAITMVVGVLMALGAREARSVISLLIVEDAGFVLLGLMIHTQASMAASLFFLVSSVFAKLGLFLATGAVEIVHGRHRLDEIHGLVKRERLLAVAFLLAAMSLAGLPPMSGFVAKFGLVMAAFASHAWVAGGIAVAVSLLTLMAIFRVWGAVFLEADGGAEEATQRVSARLAIPALLAVAVGLGLGLWAEPVLQVTQQAAQQLLAPPYVGGAR